MNSNDPPPHLVESGHPGQEPTRRHRLVRSSPPAGRLPIPGAVDRFHLREGCAYRIAYAVGGRPEGRVARRVAVYSGTRQRRRWAGDAVECLDFTLPQGRTVSVLSWQLIEVRPTVRSPRGDWVLTEIESETARHRGSRRRHPPPAA